MFFLSIITFDLKLLLNFLDLPFSFLANTLYGS